jgi:hypothetical protein
MIYTVRNWLALAELPKPFGFTLSIALQRCATIFHLSVLIFALTHKKPDHCLLF